jgi:hypothetical protein
MSTNSQNPTLNLRIEQIKSRIRTYYDLGIRFIEDINHRLATDLDTEEWSRLFDLSGQYEDHENPEAAIIQDVLTQSGRTEFIDHESDMHIHIRQRWEAGYRDTEEIAKYLVDRWFYSDVSAEMVMVVLRRMGYIV